MKKVLGLDIGTNSIGWALIETNLYDHPETLDGRILQVGSRIIPMDGDAMKKFEDGNPESKAAGRRQARSARRLNQRYKLRRTRLIEACKIMGWISKDFPTTFKKLSKHDINFFLPYSDDLRSEAIDFFELSGQKTTKGLNKEIPEDWLIYYLKTKALHSQVTLQELARILYHFNQRRGFKSSRKDNKEESAEKKHSNLEEWNEVVTVTNITEAGKGEGKYKNTTRFEVECQAPGLLFPTVIYRQNKPDWLNKSIEFRITKKIAKNGEESFNIYSVDPGAWESRKKALEKDIDKADMYLSEYYLTNIKKDRNYPIKQRIVDRSYYQEEFQKIWEVQSAFYHQEFNDKRKIAEIADTFYIHNKQKNNELKAKDLFHIFYSDIIYYQRGLKSQKGLLANCQYEGKSYKLKDGTIKSAGVKVVPKSSPIFQEFRIWQTIHNLRILKHEEIVNGKLKLNIDVTDELLTDETKTSIFKLFDNSAEVSHDAILRVLGFKKDVLINGEKSFAYKLNYPDDKNFQGNETKALFRRVFNKNSFEDPGYIDNPELLHRLWHIIYSLPEEKDIYRALQNKKYFDFPDTIIEHLSKLPEFKPQYGSLSSKAINKLLPLMRTGHYWSPKFNEPTILRINKIINGEYDENINDKTREEIKKRGLSSLEDFKGLPTFLSAYIIYGRHSERENEAKYQSIDDLKIKELIPYNSLRNPVVEKIVRETLALVKDIWKHEKLGRPDFIHVELGRELKKNNEEKKDLSQINFRNRIEKERVISLIKELKYPNFNESSISDIEKFRVWKDNGGYEGNEKFNDLFKANKSEFVSNAEIEKYRHWAEQNYRSPYSGKSIPLSELFTEKYQIDHIIPRSRFYDDSSSNKVVVESRLNDLKGNRVAIQFIEDSQQDQGVQSLEDYLVFIDKVFTNKKKKRLLKSYDVPEDFVERQMNDTKYISRTIGQLLRPIAIGTESDEGVVYTSGSITADLKGKWGLHKLWKEILRPRFERLETILGQQLIFPDENHEGLFRFGKDYKRIDHRHHALDALVIACTSRSHIKYLNSLNSFSNNKAEIAKYNQWAKWKYLLNKKKQLENKENGMTEFETPWANFYSDVKQALESVVVSHKPSSKLVSKTINKYYKWAEIEKEDGTKEWVKKLHYQQPPQDEDKFWVAVRQSLFGQPLGKIYLAEYKKGVDMKTAVRTQIKFHQRTEKKWNTEDWRIAKSILRKRIDSLITHYNGDEKEILNHLKQDPLIDEAGSIIEKLDLLQFKKYASKRVPIDESFTKDKISNMPNAGHEKNWLTKLLKDHLVDYNDDPKLAFKGEGLEMLHRKAGSRINKVTRKEGGEKIEINNKLLDGDKGVNQYFVVEINKKINKKTGKEEITRKYYTPKFMDCIQRIALGLPIHDENQNSKYIVLSPGDLVYVPDLDEDLDLKFEHYKNASNRIYIMKSSSDSKCYFLPAFVSSLITYYDPKQKKGEFESTNKSERTLNGHQIIKDKFIKINVNRLGHIFPAQ